MGPEGPQGEPGSAAPAITAWPVGSIFISVVATDPAVLLGGGTWVEFGKGRFLLATDAANPSIADAEIEGGSWTKTLVEANLPPHVHPMPHTHPINHNHGTFDTGNNGVHSHSSRYQSGWTLGTSGHWLAKRMSDTSGTSAVESTSDAGQHLHSVAVPAYAGTSGASSAADTGLAGSGTAFDISPPCITAYMWKRTA
jgi:hypothetical protein